MDQLQFFLENADYTLFDATELSIHDIQNKLRECRVDDKLIVFVRKNDTSKNFFERLSHFGLDRQNSNYYVAHSRNYAVWVDPSELQKDELFDFLEQSHSSVTMNDEMFDETNDTSNERVV